MACALFLALSHRITKLAKDHQSCYYCNKDYISATKNSTCLIIELLSKKGFPGESLKLSRQQLSLKSQLNKKICCYVVFTDLTRNNFGTLYNLYSLGSKIVSEPYYIKYYTFYLCHPGKKLCFQNYVCYVGLQACMCA